MLILDPKLAYEKNLSLPAVNIMLNFFFLVSAVLKPVTEPVTVVTAGGPALAHAYVANTSVAPTPRFVVYCRASRESPYLQFFIDWHVQLGFERIIVLVQDEHKGAYERFSADPKVILIWVDGTEPDSLPHKYLPHVLDLNPE
jgi:hypothetical protein